jgi:hypothetical protein
MGGLNIMFGTMRSQEIVTSPQLDVFLPLPLTASLKRAFLSIIARMLNESRLSEVVCVLERKRAQSGNSGCAICKGIK